MLTTNLKRIFTKLPNRSSSLRYFRTSQALFKDNKDEPPKGFEKFFRKDKQEKESKESKEDKKEEEDENLTE